MTTNEASAFFDGRDIELTRIIDAPFANVVKGWTDLGLPGQLFAPLLGTVPTIETDKRVDR